MSEQNKEESPFIEAIGLWVNSNGNLTGSFGGAGVVITKNKFKKDGSNQPDARLSFYKKSRKDAGSNTPKKQERVSPNQEYKDYSVNTQKGFTADDIPF